MQKNVIAKVFRLPSNLQKKNQGPHFPMKITVQPYRKAYKLNFAVII